MKMKVVSFCVLAIIFIFIDSTFAEWNSTELNSTEQNFTAWDQLTILSKYNTFDIRNVLVEEISKALKKFQGDHGLSQNGLLDEETRLKMIEEKHRQKDISNQNEIPSPEYNLVSKWHTNLLTWRIVTYSKNTPLTQEEQRETIMRALGKWAAVTPLVFREIKDEANINFYFYKNKDHDDYEPFGHMDIAHAWPPPFPWGIHFWDRYRWVLDREKNDGIDLLEIATHEIGHALGLHESEHRDAIMYDTYETHIVRHELHTDDIAGIQALYGTKPPQSTTETTTPRRTTTLPGGGSRCRDSYRTINAVMLIHGDVFVFVDNGLVVDGRSRLIMAISERFPGGPSFVQAAVYSNEARKAYLFYDQYVWVYSLHSNGRFHLVDGFPKFLPNSQSHNIEIAMKIIHLKREIILLIKDRLFQYFIPGYENIEPNGAYTISNIFINIPRYIDAVFSTDKDTFFIVKKTAYRMPKGTLIVDTQGLPVDEALQLCKY